MSNTANSDLLSMIRDGRRMTLRQQLLLTAQLSVPSILAQLSSIVMQYIDASMVGSLGADDSASIGLVGTSLWLLGGVCNAAATGFSVMVAHHIGANRSADARSVVRQSLVACFAFSLCLTILGVSISSQLPVWLGGNPAIVDNASRYFLIFVLSIPLLQFNMLASSMIRCSGNMRVPSAINVLMCVLDVAFNFFFIFPVRDVNVLGTSLTIPGMGLGVTGAALGTVLAELVGCILMMRYMVIVSPELNLRQDRGSFRPKRATVKRALGIGTPMGLQHIVMCTAQVAITAIVAPLGSVALAASSFAVTAESLCYMPGFGIADAATTLVGQSVGAKRRDLTLRFAHISLLLGMVIMSVTGVLLYVGAPVMMSIMSPVQSIVDLGARVLRIEAFAEPLFAAAIVCYGIMVGAGDTFKPAVMNIASMWGVRITLSLLLVGSMGLAGVWVAMCVELCFRGLIFIIRLLTKRWVPKNVV